MMVSRACHDDYAFSTPALSTTLWLTALVGRTSYAMTSIAIGSRHTSVDPPVGVPAVFTRSPSCPITVHRKEYGDAAEAHCGHAPTQGELALMDRGFNSHRLFPTSLCRELDVSDRV
jgi:hypothetical protein